MERTALAELPNASLLRSCVVDDHVPTVRAWSPDGAAWCVRRAWRTDRWMAARVDDDACACAIPRVANGNGVRVDDVRAALKRTLELTGLTDARYLDDAGCRALLRELEAELDLRERMARAFDAYKDGRIRSDMCRAAMLYKHGGYYFDDDLVAVRDVTRVLHPQTRFASVTTVRMFGNAPGLFNAFVAAAPRHPVLEHALRLHTRWPHMTAAEQRRVTRGVPLRPNIGTVLLRDALRAHLGDAAAFAAERGGQTVADVQLLREVPLIAEDSYNTTGLCVLCESTHACNFAVADVPSGEIVFKSRGAVRGTNLACPLFCEDAACVAPPRAPPPPPRQRLWRWRKELRT